MGILAAFRAHPGVSWLVAACDLPDMEIDALRWLLAFRAPGVVAVMPDLAGDGRIEPLLAYYDDSCAHLLEAMAARGQRRMNRLRAAALAPLFRVRFSSPSTTPVSSSADSRFWWMMVHASQ